MKTVKLLLMLSLCCASTAFAQRMCLSKVYSPYSETKYTYGDNVKLYWLKTIAILICSLNTPTMIKSVYT